ncbi:apolipoprotein C-II [Cyprinodon tularosa]|uniref:Apolipoprotein C-II n=1 Tax=Cyprinodon variegatus TaxID=28743 RepID=A0A3Q2DB12_CYPVA|nr:PREDICTED: apolipoprotein C-II [Cyprinodon variegatus]XP_038132247.1 apolipoprotein C-II [Cyprinodon tularosa]
MNKLLVVSVLIALLALSTEGFRLPRQVDEEEGTLSKISEAIKSYYGSALDTVNGYVDTIKGLKIEEKAKNLYSETSTVVSTYAGIMQDQIYHFFHQ